MRSAVIGYVSCGSRAEARRLADALLEQKLAACVSILPRVESAYWWKGRLERSTEWLLMIKTVRDQVEAVQKTVKKLHGYEVPEILFVPVAAGEKSYLKWLRAAVRRSASVLLLVLTLGVARADEVDELLRQLDAGDEEQRAVAAETLARVGGARAEQAFRQMLESASAERRQLGVAGLVQVSDAPSDLERIRLRLQDADATVRWTAVIALGQTGWAEVIPWLETVARDDAAESVRETAAATVAKLRNGIAWRRSVSEALHAAGGSGQSVLVYFRARGSPLCERFEQGVLADAAVAEAVKRYQCVRVDVEQSPADAKRYDVRGVPTVLLLDAKGEETVRLSGAVSKNAFLARLQEQGHVPLQEARRRALANPRDVAANWTVAAAYLDDGREELAEPYLRCVIAADEANQQGYTDRAIFALGFVLGRRGEHRQAVFCMEKLLERWPDFKDRDKALYCLGLSRLALGRTAAARSALEELLAAYPRSSMAEAAKAALEKLEAADANR